MAVTPPLKIATGLVQQCQTGDSVDPQFLGQRGVSGILFSAFPGSSDAVLTITGQAGILSTSIIKAWVALVATVDHSADEHFVESIAAFAGNIVAGTGFTLYARNTSEISEPTGQGTRISGRWSIGWEWF